MISEALRIDIEVWASRKHQNPMFRAAGDGTMTPGMVTRYIANVTHLVGSTPALLARGRDSARAQKNELLASYFHRKIAEEGGHVVWGEADLASLTRIVAAPAAKSLMPSIVALVRFLEQTIDRDPACYLPYLSFAEYITVLLGPEFLANIEAKCGVPRSAMTVVDNHIELDKEHAEEGFDLMNDLVSDPRKLAPMRAALADVLRLFDAFCAEVVTTPFEESHAAAGAQRQFSAA
jgi:hypothetical protein